MTDVPIIPGCEVLPPMNPPRPRTTANNGKAEKPKRTKQTAERFGTINAFTDFTLRSLTRSETAVWLVLWRDTKDATARTSQTDIARRAGIGRRFGLSTNWHPRDCCEWFIAGD